jgi:hypothetical protein
MRFQYFFWHKVFQQFSECVALESVQIKKSVGNFRFDSRHIVSVHLLCCINFSLLDLKLLCWMYIFLPFQLSSSLPIFYLLGLHFFQ